MELNEAPQRAATLELNFDAAVEATVDAKGVDSAIPSVKEADIASIISRVTRMPIGRVLDTEKHGLLDIEKRLQQRVVGQDHALNAIAKSIRLSRSGLRYHDRPIGVFLFLGKSGTGKTEVFLLKISPICPLYF